VGQDGVLFGPVPKARQAEAVKFLNDNAFATPTWAIDPQILRRIEAVGALSRIRNAQSSVLTNLLSSSRFARIVEQEAIDGSSAYVASEFVDDVRRGVWKELESPQVKVDAYRRNLQHAYLDLLNTKLNAAQGGGAASLGLGSFGASSDEKPLYRAELKTLNAAIVAALPKTADRETRAHLEGARDQISSILDPKFAAPSGNAGGGFRAVGEQIDPFLTPPDELNTCWPDYTIRP
jgi:hypothetical protein